MGRPAKTETSLCGCPSCPSRAVSVVTGPLAKESELLEIRAFAASAFDSSAAMYWPTYNILLACNDGVEAEAEAAAAAQWLRADEAAVAGYAAGST